MDTHLAEALRLEVRSAAKLALGAYDEEDEGMIWSLRSARGILIWNPADGHLGIAIAGTDDRSDVLHDVNTLPRVFSEWGQQSGVCVSDDAVDVVSTEGFMDYTASCSEAILAKVDAIGLKWSSVTSMTIVGHSLGGAAAYLLQLTKPFEASRTYTFGCPKTFKRGCRVPDRIRFACWHLSDPVVYLPLSCCHPKSQSVIVSRSSGIMPRTSRAFGARVFVIAYVVATWLYSVYAAVCRIWGGKPKVTAVHAHLMATYAKSLGISG